MSQLETEYQSQGAKGPSWLGQVVSSSNWALLIPRPKSFLINTILFAGGVIFAWLEGYRGINPAESGFQATTWMLFIPIIWFIVQEIFVQQAKYMWNDILDHERDQGIPANRTRAIARRPLSKSLLIVCAGRWLSGILLAAVLSPNLFFLVVCLSIMQILYELWAKPNAGKYPVIPMFIVAVGSALKSLGGGLAMGALPGDQRYWLYAVALFGIGVVYGSSLWRLEAQHFLAKGWSVPRGQSAYFFANGKEWLRAGAASSFLSCLILILDGFLGFLRITEAGILTTAVLFITVGVILSTLLFNLVSRARILFWLSMAVSGFFSILWIIQQMNSAIINPAQIFSPLLMGLLILLVYRFNYYTDYKQYTLLYLEGNWPQFKDNLLLLFSQPSDTHRWRLVLSQLQTINTKQFQINLHLDG